MKTKKLNKVLSFLVAFCLLFSCAFQAFAAESYQAEYTDKATKEIYATILDDANQAVGDAYFIGATIQSLYVMMPDLSAFVGIGTNGETNTATIEFYEQTEAKEVCAHLREFMEANNMTTVTKDVMTAYFAEYPITVSDNADFTAKLKAAIHTLLVPKMHDMVVLVFALGAGDELPTLAASFDGLSKVLGAEQATKFETTLTGYVDEDGEAIPDMPAKDQLFRDYIDHLIDALLPNVAHNVVDLIQNLAFEENNALLYKSLTDLFRVLNNMITNLEPILGMVGIDPAPIKDPIVNINNMIKALPTVGEDEQKMFDWEKSIEFLVNDVLVPELVPGGLPDFMKDEVITFGEDSKGILKFDYFNADNLKNAEDTTDAFNVIFNYLYNNINKNEATFKTVLGALPLLDVELPQDVVDYLAFVLENSKEDSIVELCRLTHGGLPLYPLGPSEPVEPTEDDDVTDDTTDDGTVDTSIPDIPMTGAEENGAIVLAVIAFVTGAALVVATKKKKASLDA